MLDRLATRVSGTRHPRLALLLLGGVAAFAVGGVALAVDPYTAAVHPRSAFRLFVAGYLLALFGGAGYVAISVSERVVE